MRKPENFDDTITIVLRESIKLGDLEISEVTLSEPVGSQLVAAEKVGLPMESLMVLIHLVGGVPPAAVNKMRQRDLQRAADFFAHFGALDSSPSSANSPQS